MIWNVLKIQMLKAPSKLTESEPLNARPENLFFKSLPEILGHQKKRKTRILTQQMMCNTFGDCLLEGNRQSIRTGDLEEMLVLENSKNS